MKKIWRFQSTRSKKVSSGKVELWLCNEVQESAKIVITQCIDNLLEATLRKIRKTKLSKKLVGAEQMRNLIEPEQVSWCRVTKT